MADIGLVKKIFAVIGVKLILLTLIWMFFINDYKVQVTPQSVESHFSTEK
jgi:hypothetical protein